MNRKHYLSPRLAAQPVCLYGPLMVIAPSGRIGEDIPTNPTDPPADEDPNAARLRSDFNPWENGLW